MKSKLRILVDRSVVEVFANDRQAITRRIYADATSTGVMAFATGSGASLTGLEIWDMMPSNPIEGEARFHSAIAKEWTTLGPLQGPTVRSWPEADTQSS